MREGSVSRLRLLYNRREVGQSDEALMVRKNVLESIPHRRASSSTVAPREFDPADAFVLAQVDGVTTVAEICDITPLAPDEVIIRLLRLEHEGLVYLSLPSTSSAPRAVRAASSGARNAVASARPLGADLRERQTAFGRWRRSMAEPETGQ